MSNDAAVGMALQCIEEINIISHLLRMKSHRHLSEYILLAHNVSRADVSDSRRLQRLDEVPSQRSLVQVVNHLLQQRGTHVIWCVYVCIASISD